MLFHRRMKDLNIARGGGGGGGGKVQNIGVRGARGANFSLAVN